MVTCGLSMVTLTGATSLAVPPPGSVATRAWAAWSYSITAPSGYLVMVLSGSLLGAGLPVLLSPTMTTAAPRSPLGDSTVACSPTVGGFHVVVPPARAS